MIKDFFRPMDNIRLDKKVVDTIVFNSLNSDNKITELKHKNKRKRITIIAAVAAVLAVIISLSFIINIKSEQTASEKTKNGGYSFTLTANAAEIKNKKLGSNVIGAFEGGSSCGPYLKGQEGVGRYIDWFQQFDLSSFKISGDNIKSVTVSSKTKGVYFNVTPIPKIIEGDISKYNSTQSGLLVTLGGRSVLATNYKTEEEYNKARKEEMKKYSKADTLNNSQYTRNQLTGASYSGFFADFVCDSFTYNNTDKNRVIDLDYVIELTVESVQTKDNNVAKYLKIINEIEENENNYTVGIGNTDRLKKDSCLYKILKAVINKATIDVTVNYYNGKSETKSFALGSYQEDNGWFTWLTLSEM